MLPQVYSVNNRKPILGGPLLPAYTATPRKAPVFVVGHVPNWVSVLPPLPRKKSSSSRRKPKTPRRRGVKK